MMAPSDLGRPVEGALWMLACGLCFVALTGIVRYIGTDLPAAQQAFLRFAFGVPLLIPALVRLARAGIPQGALGLFGLRGLVHLVAVVCWFYAMARLPVAEVTAIGYLNPVVVMLGAVLIFGERLTGARVATVLVALLGAAVVLRPGLREITDGHLAQVVAACCFAGSYLFAKRLVGLVPAGAVVTGLSVAVTIGLAPFAWWVWQPVSAEQAWLLAGTAVLGTSAHYCMTKAFAAAPLAVTQPVTFLQIVWATLLGAFIFDEAVDVYILAGAAMIIGAISLSTLAEWRASRRGEPLLPEV
ncbi:MAG: DMT family transporter [Paracoccaceae bacterium]